MDEFLKNLDAMSIEELEHVISSAQMLIQKKQQEAIRLAELEKQRQEQERLEAERKKQEEIAALQRRLKELQGNTQSDNQPKVQEDTTHERLSRVFSRIHLRHLQLRSHNKRKPLWHRVRDIV